MGVCHGDFRAQTSTLSTVARRLSSTSTSAEPGGEPGTVAAWAMTQHERRPEIWESFVRGYTEIRSINACDLAAVPYSTCDQPPVGLGVPAQNAGYRGSWRLSDSFLDTYITFLRRWQEGLLDMAFLSSEPIS